jgi:hypothetical protein
MASESELYRIRSVHEPGRCACLIRLKIGQGCDNECHVDTSDGLRCSDFRFLIATTVTKQPALMLQHKIEQTTATTTIVALLFAGCDCVGECFVERLAATEVVDAVDVA